MNSKSVYCLKLKKIYTSFITVSVAGGFFFFFLSNSRYLHKVHINKYPHHIFTTNLKAVCENSGITDTSITSDERERHTQMSPCMHNEEDITVVRHTFALLM